VLQAAKSQSQSPLLLHHHPHCLHPQQQTPASFVLWFAVLVRCSAVPRPAAVGAAPAHCP
jgi:hypothetical protein